MQKSLEASYEDAKRMFERVERPPSEQDFLDMNMAMVSAMKSKPAGSRRML
jgi:hypothetical protein